MKSKKVITIGKKEMVNLFRLAGIEGFEINSYDDLKNLYDFLQKNRNNIAGILSTLDEEIKLTKVFTRILSLDIPIVTLNHENPNIVNSISKNSKSDLESLVERAIGLKLSNINLNNE